MQGDAGCRQARFARHAATPRGRAADRSRMARVASTPRAAGAWAEVDLGSGPERVKLLRAEAVDGSGEPGMALGPDLAIACGSGAVRILELQRAGGRAMDARPFLRGTTLASGTRFG